MDFRMNYNGVDITDSITADLQSCILTDRYGGLLDSIKLAIIDTENKWCYYGMSEGDEIIIKTDDYSTGSMYITKIDKKHKLITVDAVSLKPSEKKAKSKVWRNVRLFEILNDCAKNNGLSLKTYGVSDFYYELQAQIHKTDLEFTSQLCCREGYSVKVDNNCLIVFNEQYLESQETDLTINRDDVNPNYLFVRSSGVNNITVSYYDLEKGLIEQTAVDDKVFGNSEVINERVASFDEAKRFAFGHLRNRNKRCIVGYLTMPYNSKISAGTVLRTEGFQEFDDKYVVTEISHNIKNETSSLTIRKVLDY